MKTADLTGAALDYWVGRVEDFPWIARAGEASTSPPGWSPSTRWADGGPIVESEKIAIWPVGDEGWSCYPQGSPAAHAKGPTILIAAMRAYVASKLGEEVPDA